jgi:NAD(P)-dependent dehydrogenase (short-subunit alcohol dehydrogenase family)
VLNAGLSFHAPFESMDEDEMGIVFKKLMDINYLGYIYCTYYALPHLKKSGGQIAVISSLSGELGLPLRTAYCGSKFAVKGTNLLILIIG